MIIGIDMGHTVSGANYGAVGVLKESEETRRLGNLVISKLQAMGHTVINCTVDKASSNNSSINTRVNNANRQALDIFVSLHFNSASPSANGAEVLTYKGKVTNAANRVIKALENVGFRNRGIKDALTSKGDKIGVVYRTKAEAMLIETCFISNEEDCNRYTNNIDKIATAIAEGITGEKIVNKPTGSDSVKDKTGVITGDRVRARLEPNGTILGHFNKGDKVKLYRLEDEWYHCYSQFNTNKMYIHKDYVKIV